MEFTISREGATIAAASLSPISNKKQIIEALNTILISVADGRVTFTASDANITLILDVTEYCHSMEDGEFAAYAAPLFAATQSKAETVIKKKGNGLVAENGDSFRIPGLPADQFIQIPKVEGACISCDAKELQKSIDFCKGYAVQADGITNTALIGINFHATGDTFRIYAAQERRMAFSDMDAATGIEQRFVLPESCLSAMDLPKGEVRICVNPSHVSFQTTLKTYFISRINAEPFDPNTYVNQTYPVSFDVEQEELLAACNTARPFISAESPFAELLFAEDGESLQMKTHSSYDGSLSSQIISATLFSSGSKEERTVGLNVPDLIHALKKLRSGAIGFSCGNHRSATITDGKRKKVVLAIVKEKAEAK